MNVRFDEPFRLNVAYDGEGFSRRRGYAWHTRLARSPRELKAQLIFLLEEAIRRPIFGAIVLTALLVAAPASAQDSSAVIAHALKAAPTSIAENATVMDWAGNTLREGTNGWVCFPDPPEMEAAPMCLDAPWQAWAGAWQNRQPVTIEHVGIAYMLMGDAGASNIDPYAGGPTADNEWVESGPHLMLIVPDPAALGGVPTDPENGGPWIMWKGTPYAHVMIPVVGHH